ncbi:hypothetical protein AM614_15575 [Listeria monocytogenes]|nr:hypothetical protein [Listeria monocytogenes]EAF5405601.1 hypothetical protein [Listeria monocytogenes]EAG4727448.1 hypothetical protein [Listeria monocytogenes]EAG5553985.1 hypothetical protein [Listeria monocytogenes]ECC0367812.1 hypothetical protein [Listeria monocytogenes]
MKKHKRGLKICLAIITIVVLFLVVMTVLNKTFHTSYAQMDKTDQAFFKQLNTLYSNTKNKPLWQGYNLAENPVLFVRKGSPLNFSEETVNLIRGNVYAVGVKGLEGKWYAKKIKLPDSYKMPDVYRLAITTPGIWETWSPLGNFSSITMDEKTGKSKQTNMQVGGSSHVYYFKYGKSNLENPLKPSQAAIPFYTHEAFHYFAQKDWQGSDGNIGLESKNTEWYSLLGLQYKVLDNIMAEVQQKDKDGVSAALSDYRVVSDARRKLDSKGYQDEKSHETIEGTATYVGIKSSVLTGGDPIKLQLLSGAKDDAHRKFFTLFESIAYSPSYVSEFKWNRYDSGALLSAALDEVDSNNWQTIFSQKASNDTYTLDDRIHELKYSGKVNNLNAIKQKYDFQNIEKLSEKLVSGLNK